MPHSPVSLPQILPHDERPGVGGALRPVPWRTNLRRSLMSGSALGLLGSALLGLAALTGSDDVLAAHGAAAALVGGLLLIAAPLLRTRTR